MKSLAAILSLVILIGGAWILMPSTPDTGSAAEANQQAAAMVADLYQKQGSPVPLPTTSEAPNVPSAITDINEQKIMKAIVHTNKGAITIDFMETDAPNTVANFVKLAREGYYNGTKFHRVIAGFMIQGGELLGIGTSGPSYKCAD